ncbi:MAG: hypothetical protein LUO89_11230 [Methanothrix sp.]|nr:hypothetical protein [Methanothrix sp.]
MKRLLPVFAPWLICLALLFVVAFAPLAEAAQTWRDVLKGIIMLIVAAAGSPFTQLIKNMLKLEGRQALLLTGVVAGLFALLEMWLSGVLKFSEITIDNFPFAFTSVMTVATFYYGLLKGAEGFFGKKALLKKPT